ncbi:MAG: ABC transporter permease [Pseudomonadota bacterium]
MISSFQRFNLYRFIHSSIPFLRVPSVMLVLVGSWQFIVWATQAEHFILPSPGAVFLRIIEQPERLLANAIPTTIEIVAGLALGTLIGAVSAITLALFRPARQWLLPVLVVSQAIPVFALAPILVLWLGYGMASKIAMAAIIIFFPVTSALYDGLRRVDPGHLDLARTMGASRWRTLLHIQIPTALPAFGSGLRVAAAVAPIGAVVGEWVGSSEGLGYLMLHANGRMQVDLMFAALFVLAIIAVTIFFAVDRAVSALTPWVAEQTKATHS